MNIEDMTDEEIEQEQLRRHLARKEIQRQIWTGEREVTDGDDIHDDPRSWRHQ